MNTIEFENKIFHALKGFSGYYASLDGEVLSTKHKPRIIKHGKNTLGESYHLSINNKTTTVTKSRIIYMAQTGCSLNDLNGCWVGLKDGKYIKSENKSEVETRQSCEPLKDIQFMRNEMDILEAFYLTGNVSQMKKYIDDKREELEMYGIRSLMQGREKVIGLVSDTLSDFYVALYALKVTKGIVPYIKGIMRKRVAIQKKERAMFLYNDFLYDKISLNDWAS